MRYALIDNSTLTAVQRVLGQIPIKNKHLIDADIPALESFIQTILFYDDLVFLDDYKESYRASRQAFFNRLTGYRLTKQTYTLLVEQAKQLTESIVLNVAGGKIVDGDFAPFFEMLQMNLVFTWDMASSTFYLTVKALEGSDGIDRSKYGQLSSMIYSELMEKKRAMGAVETQEPILYDSRGNRICQDYNVGGKDARISVQTQTFFASLNWLAFRTILYTLTAKLLNIDLCLHPIRNSFQVNLLAKAGADPSKIQVIISAMNGEANKAINNIFEITQPFVLEQKLPMFTAWLAEKTGNSNRFIETAYEIRQEKIFVDARRQLSELQEILSSNDNSTYLKCANSLVKDVQEQAKKIAVRFGVDTPQGIPTSPMISVWNLSTLATGLPQLPDLDIQIEQLSFLRDILPGKGFKSVYRTLMQDLTKIERLGKYHDIITSNIVMADDADYFNMKVEDMRYLGRRSSWKIPM